MAGSKYNHKKIENNWRTKWFADNIYEAVDFSPKPKKYILAELPYPSGRFLHIGHMMRYTVPEIYSRFLRMQGYNVMFPMGWDCFGLPAETFAIKEGITPQSAIAQAVVDYKKAMQDMGYAIDWNREINTSDTNYYKWTQWMFTKLWQRGLAEIKEMPVWWCKELGVLADEEVLPDPNSPTGRKSERGGYPVERKMFKQWVLKIPEYADRLIADLDKTDYTESVKQGQINWIGRKEGANIIFEIAGEKIEVFTTRPDTIFGVTFLAISPKHPVLNRIIEKAKNKAEIQKYIEKAKNLSDLEKQTKEKTGVKIEGITAKHPFVEVTDEIPVFIADYILTDYGTGAVMGVPAHDERDYEFALKYGLEIKPVIKGTKRETFIFIHGWGNNKDSGFFPKLEAHLLSKGEEVINETFPSGENAKFEEWYQKVEKTLEKIDKENSISLIGHSSGAYMALKISEKFKINKLYLVAPVSPISHYSKDTLEVVKSWGSATFNLHTKFHSAEIDISKVKENTNQIIYILGKSDPYIKGSILEYHKTNFGDKADFFELDYGHMGNKDGAEAANSIIQFFDKNISLAAEIIINSPGRFSIHNGSNPDEFKEIVISELEKIDKGKKAKTYKLRDQVFSRQRYWGEPIPLIYKEDGTVEAVSDDALPVELPIVKNFTSEDGSSPLAKNKEWVETTDSEGKPANREVDTMPTWAGSNWYYIRYIDPNNNNEFADMEKMKYWLPVDNYYGAASHTTAHLIYSRFWYKVLYDYGFVPTAEPYMYRMSGGLLLGSDNHVMSKSRGNTVDPKDVIENYGTDAARTYLAFIGPYEETYPWNPSGIKACYRLIKTIYDMRTKVAKEKATENDKELTRNYHKMIKNITEMTEKLKMNTAVSEIMIFTNELKKVKVIPQDIWQGFIKVTAPFAPFVAEELWQETHGYKKWQKENSVHLQNWPKFDLELAKDDEIELPVQINGKLKATLSVKRGLSQSEVQKLALADEKVSGLVSDKNIKKFVYVPDKILNIVL